MSSKKSNPADFLKQILGKVVSIKLHNGAEYVGVLASLDGTMNIILEHAEEFEGGELKNKYGIIFLRGNNVYYISQKPAQPKKQK